MSLVKVSRTHNRSDSEVRAMVEELAANLKQRYDLEARWLDDATIGISHQRMSGRLTLEPGRVSIELKLGLLAGAFKSTIEQELRRALEEKLA